MKNVMLLTPFGYVLSTTIHAHIRIVLSADALRHIIVPFGRCQLSAHSTREECVIPVGDAESVDVFKMRRDVEVYPHLQSALL